MARRRPAKQSESEPAERMSPASPKWAAVALLVLVAATYWPVQDFDFAAYDDYEYVVENPNVSSGLTWANVKWAFTHGYQGTGGPLTWLSHMKDVEWFGVQAGPHHVVNVVIHAAGTVALLWALYLLTGAVWPSAWVAALFAVHPLHVESVAWIAERKDVLSGLFWFLTIACYVRYVRRPDWPRYLTLVAMFVLGALSKPMVATLPFVLLLLDVWPLGRWRVDQRWSWPSFSLVREKLPLFAIGIGALALTFFAQQARGAIAPVDAIPLDARLANAVTSYGTYLAKTLWPTDLVPYYPFRLDIPAIQVAASAIAIAAFTWVAIATRRRLPTVAVGWFWYLGTLVPVIGIVQVGGHAMADRFTYLPLVGIFIALVWALDAIRQRVGVSPRLATVAAVAVVCAAAVVAREQTMVWRDGESLWRHAVAVDPANARAQSNLGAVLARRGLRDEAVRAYRAALRVHPDVPQTQFNLGLLLEEIGNTDEAISHYREAVRLNAGYAKPRAHVANLLAQRGETAEALEHFDVALQLEPSNVLLHVNKGITLARAGRQVEGVESLRAAMTLEPARAQWRYTAAIMLIELGRIDEAKREMEEALRLEPGHRDSQIALDVIRQSLGKR